MTNQEAFDKVKAHLLLQNSRALYKNRGCCYKDQNGKKCAVGCLIPDELYEDRFEGSGVIELLRKSTNLRALFDGLDAIFLMDLQLVHDTKDPKDWPECLNHLATVYGLNP